MEHSEMAIKDNVNGARLLADHEKEAVGRGPKGRQLSIISTKLEEVEALIEFWGIGRES